MIEKCIRRVQVVSRLFDLLENELEDLKTDAGNIIVDRCVNEKGMEQSADIITSLEWIESYMEDIKSLINHIEDMEILS